MNLSAVIFRTMPALERLVRRRTPGPAPIRLSRADIFILPTRSGIWFGLLILALILISINYNNNLTYFLAFLLGSVAFISTWATYRELAGLILAGASAAPVHAGSTARAGIILRNDSRPRNSLRLSMAGGKNEQISIVTGTSVPVDLAVPTKVRGWMAPGPVLMETSFPLGLFRAWSRPDPELKILVYPRPSPYSIPLEMLRSRVQQGRDIPSDEFQGLRPYTTGDSMTRIDWRALARQQGLMTKSFRSASRSDGLFLDLDAAPGKDLEERLSRLTRAALDAHASGLSFGLRLNQTIIEPDRGEAHSAQVLKALALYEPA